MSIPFLSQRLRSTTKCSILPLYYLPLRGPSYRAASLTDAINKGIRKSSKFEVKGPRSSHGRNNERSHGADSFRGGGLGRHRGEGRGNFSGRPMRELDASDNGPPRERVARGDRAGYKAAGQSQGSSAPWERQGESRNNEASSTWNWPDHDGEAEAGHSFSPRGRGGFASRGRGGKSFSNGRGGSSRHDSGTRDGEFQQRGGYRERGGSGFTSRGGFKARDIKESSSMGGFKHRDGDEYRPQGGFKNRGDASVRSRGGFKSHGDNEFRPRGGYGERENRDLKPRSDDFRSRQDNEYQTRGGYRADRDRGFKSSPDNEYKPRGGYRTGGDRDFKARQGNEYQHRGRFQAGGDSDFRSRQDSEYKPRGGFRAGGDRDSRDVRTTQFESRTPDRRHDASQNSNSDRTDTSQTPAAGHGRDWSSHGESAGHGKGMPLSLPYTTPASEFLYGTSVVKAALTSKKLVRRKFYRLYIYDGENRKHMGRDAHLEQLAKEMDIKIDHVSNDSLRMMDKMAAGRPHNGYILEASPLPRAPIRSLGALELVDGVFGYHLVRDAQSREELEINGDESFMPLPDTNKRKPLVLLLECIEDPGNLGGIIRTASFLGVTAVAVSTHGSAAFTPVVLKAAAGACESMTLFAVAKPADFISGSKRAGWKVYAAVPPGRRGNDVEAYSANEIDDPLRMSPGILMLGGEGCGLKKKLRDKADVEIYISGGEAKPSVNSLNVNVAAGIICSAFATHGKGLVKQGTDTPGQHDDVESDKGGELDKNLDGAVGDGKKPLFHL